MPHRYALLQVEPNGLTGPLAPVMEEEVSKHVALLSVLRGVSRLKSSKKVELLGISCHVDDDGKFHANPTGLLGNKMGAKMAETVTNWVNNKGWAILHRNGQLIFTMYQPAIPSAP
jgi:hypothetical protein